MNWQLQGEAVMDSGVVDLPLGLGILSLGLEAATLSPSFLFLTLLATHKGCPDPPFILSLDHFSDLLFIPEVFTPNGDG